MDISDAAQMQTFPIWRATSAACELTPPRDVKMPSAAIIPRKSSGEVSSRQRIAFLPFECNNSACDAENTTAPVAAPGPAGSPPHIIPVLMI